MAGDSVAAVAAGECFRVFLRPIASPPQHPARSRSARFLLSDGPNWSQPNAQEGTKGTKDDYNSRQLSQGFSRLRQRPKGLQSSQSHRTILGRDYYILRLTTMVLATDPELTAVWRGDGEL